MAPPLPPISAEALKTIALVLHGRGRGCASRVKSREIILHALILVRDSEGPLDPDDACRWLEEVAGLSVGQALTVRELAARVAERREIAGRSPLRAQTLQIWRDRAAGRDESPFDRLREALYAELGAAAV